MADTEKKAVWEPTTNRFVGFIDIMGFKDMIARKSHQDMYRLMKNIHALNQDIMETNSLLWDDDMIKLTTYSDSIIIYSKDNSKEALECFLFTVSNVSETLFAATVPHKGAIAYGLMTFDEPRSIFFGQPLIDAYLLEEELLFYGLLIHGTAEKEIGERRFQLGEIKNYKCPLKLGNSDHLVLLPYYVKTEVCKEGMYRSLQELRFNTSGSIRKYIDNTETYFNTVLDFTPKK